MKYTYQKFSNGFSTPDGSDVGHASTMDELLWVAEGWKDVVERYHDLADADASIMVWKGVHKDVTDVYPDFELYYGPRGGVRKTPV